MIDIRVLVISHLVVSCEGEICLVGGNSTSGNLYIRGKPVCDDSWDIADSRVVCKTIGFGEALRATTNSEYDIVLFLQYY